MSHTAALHEENARLRERVVALEEAMRIVTNEGRGMVAMPAAALAKAITEAVETEREECARQCEWARDTVGAAGHRMAADFIGDCAEAIRARSKL